MESIGEFLQPAPSSSFLDEPSRRTPRRVVVLGSTGSIGLNTLDVVARNPDRFRVLALAAKQRVDRLFEQCRAFRPTYAVLLEASDAQRLAELLRGAGITTEVLWGEEAFAQVAGAPETDVVVAGIVGAAGLKSAMAAARAGKTVLLANKEALVMAGSVFMEAVRAHGATLLPVDSEHNAILQALPGGRRTPLDAAGVRRLWLTASGGPLRTLPAQAFSSVTPEQACAHPNWTMGKKISVDSATLMNKGLEVIEACWLFDVAVDRVQVVIHPQSIIHSMVEYRDGSIIAQLGYPDMRTPIAYALGYPERIDAGVPLVDVVGFGRLEFEAPDVERFPCLALAYRAIEAGGNAPAVLNAANEVAVEAFLDRRIPFTAIPDLINYALDRVPAAALHCLEDVLGADRAGREAARNRLDSLV